MDNNARPDKRINRANNTAGAFNGFWDGFFVKGQLDVPMVVITVIVACIGLVMLLSASYPESYRDFGHGYTYFRNQAGFMILGFVGMFIASKVNYNKLRIFAWPALVGSLLLVLAAIFLGISEGDGGGVNRRLGFFQPSEITKFAVILFCANGLSKNHKKMLSTKPSDKGFANIVSIITGGRLSLTESTVTMFWYALIIAGSAGVVFLGSHLSGAIIIMAIGVFMLWLGEAKAKWFVAGAIIVVVALVLVINFYEYLPLQEYMKTRLRTFFDGNGDTWQTDNGLYALGSGGVFGLGIDGSKQKYSFVSEPHTDFIFTIVGEEIGFIGCMIIIALFCVLIGRGMYIAFKAKNRFGTLLAMGVMVHIALQVGINLAVITDLIPNTGISLPLFSYGGTAVIMTLCEIGVVLGVSRLADLPKIYSFRDGNKKLKKSK